MAGVYSKAEPPMTCCLGNHPLNNPRLLPCQHSFCTECIKTKVGDERKDFVCPKCQLSITLTEKEVDQLPEDVLYHVMQETKGKAECIFCKFEGKKTPGTFQCLDCADIFCDQCQKGHTKSSFTVSHRVVTIKEIQEGKYEREIQAENLLLCHAHSKPNKPKDLEYYCEQCKQLACHMCLFCDHQPKGHTCKTIDEIHDEKSTALKDQVAKLLDLQHKVTEFAAVLDQELGQNKELQEKLENEVHDRASEFINIIEKLKEDTLTTIRGSFKNEDTSIRGKLQEAKNRIVRIESLVCYSQAFLKQAAKSQFLQHENEMMQRLSDQKQQKMDRYLRTNILELGEPKYAKALPFIKEAFGKITIKSKKLSNVGSVVQRDWMKEPKVLFCKATGFDSAWSVTMTENEEIVAVGGTTIQVYNNDGTPKERIACSQLQKAWNVVVKGEILYVSSRDNNGKVLVMDFKGIVRKTITLPSEGVAHSYSGLAIDDDGNVYVTSRQKGAIYKCEPNETNAKILIQNGKHPDLKEPWYISITPGGNVIISNYSSNTIQMFDRYGEFLWQYKGQGGMVLNSPHGVCCDEEDYIYIADCLNSRIQVVKDGVFQNCVKIPNLVYPCGITLDKDNNIVCTYDSGKQIAKVKIWE